MLAILVSGIASAQQGGFEWINENQGIGRIGFLGEFKQVGTFLTDYTATTTAQGTNPRTSTGYIFEFTRVNGGWSYSATPESDPCFEEIYMYRDADGRYRIWEEGYTTPIGEGDFRIIRERSIQDVFNMLAAISGGC